MTRLEMLIENFVWERAFDYDATPSYVAEDSYKAGYEQAKADAIKKLEDEYDCNGYNTAAIIYDLGENEET